MSRGERAVLAAAGAAAVVCVFLLCLPHKTTA